MFYTNAILLLHFILMASLKILPFMASIVTLLQKGRVQGAFRGALNQVVALQHLSQNNFHFPLIQRY